MFYMMIIPLRMEIRRDQTDFHRFAWLMRQTNKTIEWMDSL